MTQHPITPPPELVQEWLEDSPEDDEFGIAGYIATQAARWGADQELEACCEWVSQWAPRWPDGTRTEDELRAARRPKPPSLKEQALDAHNRMMAGEETQDDWVIVRRALEALPE
jgi:hypothetical protein